MTEVKKDKNYYRKWINAHYSGGCAVLKDMVKQYGDKTSRRGERTCYNLNTTMHSNYKIEGFCFYKKELYVDIYWQGDDTDGNLTIEFSKIKGGDYRIPADRYDDGYRERTRHGEIRVTEEALHEAILAAGSRLLDKK